MQLKLIIGALLYQLPVIAIACSCAPPLGELHDEIRAALSKADRVALARVLSSRKFGAHESGGSNLNTQLLTQFMPLKEWKGSQTEKIQVLTYSEATMCGKSFSKDVEYLLYLYGPDENGYYQTNSCTRTASAEKSTQEIQLLDQATKK